MPNFVYMARDKSGVLQTGRLDAADEDQAVAVLQHRGLIVTSVTRRDQVMEAHPVRPIATHRLHQRVTTTDKVQFCDQLAVLLEAGVPLMRSLEVMEAQAESRALLRAIERISKDLEAGSTFRDALAKHPKIFSNFWVNLVETGEASGHLAQSLRQLGQYLETIRQLQTKALTAVTYPIVLVGASVVAILIFMLYIIPIFRKVFDAAKVPLPLLTRMVLVASDFVRQFFPLLVIGAIVGIWLLLRFLKTERGRWLRDRVLLRIPIFKVLFIHLQLAQFARGTGTLLESGVPILFSLEIVESSATNKVYARAVGEIKEAVRQGKPMAYPMEETGLFPPMMVQMVQVGEEVGEVSKMLGRVALYYEGKVDTFIQRLSVLFEPVAILTMAVVIGTLVVAMYLPIFQLALYYGVAR